MSGHSKWHNIRLKKGKVDAQKGRFFSKISKEIIIAVRDGGSPDPDSNLRLRMAIVKAKEVNMPNDNIKRAILKGSGEGGRSDLEEITYEGYGPAGVAIYIEALTDNRNRTASDIRSTLSRNGGNLGENGCVGWMFAKKGIITVDKDDYAEDELFNTAIEAGAEDFKAEDDYEIITDPTAFEDVKKALTEQSIKIKDSQITMIASTNVAVGEKEAKQVLRLMDSLEDHDDVQHVYSNFDISDEIMAKIEA